MYVAGCNMHSKPTTVGFGASSSTVTTKCSPVQLHSVTEVAEPPHLGLRPTGKSEGKLRSKTERTVHSGQNDDTSTIRDTSFKQKSQRTPMFMSTNVTPAIEASIDDFLSHSSSSRPAVIPQSMIHRPTELQRSMSHDNDDDIEMLTTLRKMQIRSYVACAMNMPPFKVPLIDILCATRLERDSHLLRHVHEIRQHCKTHTHVNKQSILYVSWWKAAFHTSGIDIVYDLARDVHIRHGKPDWLHDLLRLASDGSGATNIWLIPDPSSTHGLVNRAKNMFSDHFGRGMRARQRSTPDLLPKSREYVIIQRPNDGSNSDAPFANSYKTNQFVYVPNIGPRHKAIKSFIRTPAPASPTKINVASRGRGRSSDPTGAFLTSTLEFGEPPHTRRSKQGECQYQFSTPPSRSLSAPEDKNHKYNARPSIPIVAVSDDTHTRVVFNQQIDTLDFRSVNDSDKCNNDSWEWINKLEVPFDPNELSTLSIRPTSSAPTKGKSGTGIMRAARKLGNFFSSGSSNKPQRATGRLSTDFGTPHRPLVLGDITELSGSASWAPGY